MSALTRATEAWGEALPDWVTVLAEECDATSQAATARRIGYSPAVVNTVLKAAYKGDVSAVEQAVKGALLDATVNCPVAGPLAAHVCLEYQRRPFKPTNAQRVKLYKTCHGGCPHKRR